MNPHKLKLIFFSLFLISYIYCQTETEIDDIDDIFSMIRTEDEYFRNLDFKDIVSYDNNNYQERIEKDKPLLLYIYVPFSPDCQKYITEFISLGQFLKKNKTEITLAKINVHDNRKFGRDYKIEEFPSIFFFDNNNNLIKIKQEKTEYNLIKFINKKLYGDVIEYNQLSEINELVSNKKFKKNQIFVLSTLSGINNKNIFYKYANENNREIFIYCISKQCYNEYNENVIIFKNFDEKIQKYSDFYKNEDKLEIDKLKEFIIKNSIESGALLENEYFSLCNEYKRKMLIYFRDSESIKEIKKDNIIKEVGFKLREKIGYTFISDIKGNDFNKKISEDFVIAEHELPTLLFVDDIDLKEKKFKTYRITNIDSEKLTKEYILKFIEDIQNKKILIDLKSQFPPLVDDKDIMYSSPYKIVVGRTYDKEVINEKRNVLITFVDRKNKCILCNKYLSLIKELKKSNKNDKYKNISYVVIDGGNNEARDITFKEEELPFIYFYSNAEVKKSKYKFNPKEKEKVTREELETFINKIIYDNNVKEDL